MVDISGNLLAFIFLFLVVLTAVWGSMWFWRN